MRRALIALIAVLLVAPEGAGAAGPRVRAQAQQLALMDARFTKSVEDRLDRVSEQLEKRLKSCTEWPGTRGQQRRMVSLYFRLAAARIGDDLARYNRRLDAFRSHDRALRRAARAMSRAQALLIDLGESPPRPCDYFDAWKKTGYDEDFRIEPPVRNFTRAEVARLRRDARTIRAAASRMRRLGVSPARVENFRQGWKDGALFGQLAL